MKILFLAEPYMNLHQPIIDEMERQGHEVTFVKDEHLSFDWHQPWRGWHDKLRMLIKAKYHNSYSQYWKNRIRDQREFTAKYDMLFAINGCCVHKTLIRHLKKMSPFLKTVLYIWDNSSFYDYFHNAGLFDKVVTYDYNDHIRFNVPLLPFYWIETDTKKTEPKYLLSTIGSNHDGRLDICRKVYASLGNLPQQLNKMKYWGVIT